jgi:hypothetical protein
MTVMSMCMVRITCTVRTPKITFCTRRGDLLRHAMTTSTRVRPARTQQIQRAQNSSSRYPGIVSGGIGIDPMSKRYSV